MKKVDMHFASFISDTSYDLIDTCSLNESLPDNDIFFGGQNDLKFVSYTKTATALVLVYNRALDTGDKWDYKVTLGQPFLLNFVWGRENYPVYHHDRIYETSATV